MEHSEERGISHIAITAGLFVVALVAIGAWQTVRMIQTQDTATTFIAPQTLTNAAVGASASAAQSLALGTSADATNTDPIAAVSNEAIGELVGAYAGLQQEGQYSTSSADQIAGTIGEGLQAPVTYPTFSASNIPTNPDTSYQSMMDYRAALQTSLKPLLNNTEPEYQLFALYVQTKQQTYLDQLHAYAANYRAAASSTALITVPVDAVSVQLGLLDSMEEFASVLDTLANHAQDPIASTILLENYNQGETDVLNAFQALVTYEQSKKQ